MIQTLNLPYSSKTDEIMSRYRPIAPKPELPTNNNNNNTTNSNKTTNNNNYDSNNGALVPEKFRQSPYLRNIWSHLQARPTRTRKRSRGSGISPAAAAALLRKQQEQQHGQQQQQQQQQPQLPNSGVRQTFLGLCSARNLSMQAFGIYATEYQHTNNNNNECSDSVNINNNNNNNNNIKNNNKNNVVELPLLSCPMLSSKPIDLNIDAMDISSSSLDETDLQLQLQVSTGSSNKTTKGVISPRPVRPVGSTITIVGPISENTEASALVKAYEEVEAEAEGEALPAVITDRGNKVRMVNSAYKELVGQPECLWLDTMCTGGRISGEVMLQLKESGLPGSSNGFSCWVRIEWESNGKKNSVNAFCDVVKLVCMSKDYLFSWRFHTREVSS